MTIDSEKFYQQKVAWLASQVNVDFPTPESVKGRDIYVNQVAINPEEYKSTPSDLSDTISVLQVTEHRLTIRWAMTVASQWKDETEYSHVLEFLTQIDLCDEYQLFVALDGMKPVAACLSQISENVMYVSDVVLTSNDININSFLSSVLEQQSNLTGDSFTSCIRK